MEDITFQWRFDNKLGSDRAGAGDGVALNIGGKMVAVPLKAVGVVTNYDNGASANFNEQYTLSMVSGNRRAGTRVDAEDAVRSGTLLAKPLDFIGDKTFGGAAGYAEYVNGLHNSGGAYHRVTLSGCPTGAQEARVFVGQRKESFSVNLGNIFDLVNFNPINIEDNDSNNLLADKNITTLALEVHKDCLTSNGNGVIGAWTTASSQQIRILNPTATFERAEVVGGAWTQVSRLGSPLVNEVVIGLPDKNRFNASQPLNDGQFLDYVSHPTLPAILDLLFNGNNALNPDGTIAPTLFPRTDLIAAFLTGFAGVNQLDTVTPSEMLRLNTAIAATMADEQSNLGVAAGDLAGFPNGRRPGDDVTDLALRVVMGALCHNIAVDLNQDSMLGEEDNLNVCGGNTPAENESKAPTGSVPFRDGAPQNASQFDVTFPYLKAPLSGSLAAGDGS